MKTIEGIEIPDEIVRSIEKTLSQKGVSDKVSQWVAFPAAFGGGYVFQASVNWADGTKKYTCTQAGSQEPVFQDWTV